MVEHARRAAVADVARVVELAHELRDELRVMRGGDLWFHREARPEPLDAEYRALLDDDDAAVFVGTIDDVVVGFATVSLETLRSGEVLGVVDELYVEPEARSVSVGDALAGALVAFCTERGCRGIDALALPGHRAAKNFFEGHGFTARALVMHHRLGPGPVEPERPGS